MEVIIEGLDGDWDNGIEKKRHKSRNGSKWGPYFILV